MLYQNFTTKNIDFVVRFFEYDSIEDLLWEQKEEQHYEAITSCNYEEEAYWLHLHTRQLGKYIVKLYFPNGSDNGPWNIRVECDVPAVDYWSTSAQVPGPNSKRSILPTHIGQRLFHFGESLVEPFRINGSAHMQIELSPTRSAFANLYGSESAPIVRFEVLDWIEFEGPEIPWELEDIPF